MPDYLRMALMFVTFLGLSFIASRHIRLRGKTALVGARGVRVIIRRGKHNSLMGAVVATEFPGGHHFSLQWENLFDRLAKSTGIAREWQSGDPEFDARVYVACDDPVLLTVFSTDAPLRAAIMRMLVTKSRSIHCINGQLVVKCGPEGESKDLTDEFLQPKFAERFADDLHFMVEHLRPAAHSALDSARDPAIGPRWWMATLCMGLAVAGLIGGLVDFHLDDRQVVYETIRRLDEWIVAGASLVFLTVFALRMLGSSTAHRILLDVVLAGLPGLWLAVGGVLTSYNEYRDASAPQRLGVRVENAYRTKNKSKWNYYLIVASWPDPRGRHKVEINQDVFGFVMSGGCVDVDWRRGQLGDGWVSGYAPHDSNNCEGVSIE